MPSQSPKAGAEAAAVGDAGGDDADVDIFAEDVDLNVVSPDKLQVIIHTPGVSYRHSLKGAGPTFVHSKL